MIAESSAWGARLRFALAEIEPELRAQLTPLCPGFREVIVRVRPGRVPAAKA